MNHRGLGQIGIAITIRITDTGIVVTDGSAVPGPELHTIGREIGGWVADLPRAAGAVVQARMIEDRPGNVWGVHIWRPEWWSQP